MGQSLPTRSTITIYMRQYFRGVFHLFILGKGWGFAPYFLNSLPIATLITSVVMLLPNPLSSWFLQRCEVGEKNTREHTWQKNRWAEVGGILLLLDLIFPGTKLLATLCVLSIVPALLPLALTASAFETVRAPHTTLKTFVESVVEVMPATFSIFFASPIVSGVVTAASMGLMIDRFGSFLKDKNPLGEVVSLSMLGVGLQYVFEGKNIKELFSVLSNNPVVAGVTVVALGKLVGKYDGRVAVMNGNADVNVHNEVRDEVRDLGRDTGLTRDTDHVARVLTSRTKGPELNQRF